VGIAVIVNSTVDMVVGVELNAGVKDAAGNACVEIAVGGISVAVGSG
jgi:hypothetical protein